MTLQTLARKLAERHGLALNEAELFVGQFFTQLAEGLQADQYVKVKGLGTFKLMMADGRRQVIFQPDALLGEGVNKPFAHFEPVVLKETTHFPDLEEPVPATATPPVAEEAETPAVAEVEEAVAPPLSPDEPETPVATAGEQVEVSTDAPARHLLRLPWCMMATLLLVGVLVGGGIVWALLSGRRYIPASVEKVLLTVADTARTKALQTVAQEDTVVTADSATTAAAAGGKDHPAASVPLPVASPERKVLSDTVKYRIKGTLATHTIQPGESLVKLARKYYGNKQLWTYLVSYNKDILPDADHVAVGLTVRVPDLEPVAGP